MQPNQEWLQSILLPFDFLSWFYSWKSFSVVKNSICFWISVKFFALCRLVMTIAVALFIGSRRTNIWWKPEEDVNTFGIQSFWSFHFEFWSKIQYSHFPQICPVQNSSSIHQLRYNISPEPLIAWRHVNTRWKVKEVLYIIFYSTLCLSPATTVLVSYFLTAARSQVRFDISTGSVIFRSWWQSQTSSLAMMIQKCIAISTLLLWLNGRPRDLVSWHQKFFYEVTLVHRTYAYVWPNFSDYTPFV
jgi:hypothetical protein